MWLKFLCLPKPNLGHCYTYIRSFHQWLSIFSSSNHELFFLILLDLLNSIWLYGGKYQHHYRVIEVHIYFMKTSMLFNCSASIHDLLLFQVRSGMREWWLLWRSVSTPWRNLCWFTTWTPRNRRTTTDSIEISVIIDQTVINC